VAGPALVLSPTLHSRGHFGAPVGQTIALLETEMAFRPDVWVSDRLKGCCGRFNQ